MWKQFKKLAGNKSGFTLTEVMIGIMILTVAIVSATNLLVGLISTNQNNLTTLKAYYLAQEGLEAVRNIRDTNWLHNQEWLGEESGGLWGGSFEVDNSYAVNLEYGAFDQGVSFQSVDDIGTLSAVRPWSINIGGEGKIFKYSNGNDVYLASEGVGEDTGFKRTVAIKPYENEEGDVLDDYVLVEVKVEWELGSKSRELVLSGILTNWKDGAL